MKWFVTELLRPPYRGNHLHTYIIGHYNPSVRVIDLVSHKTYVVCVNFLHKWRDLQFKVDSKRFWETFHGNAERKSPKNYFLYFVLMSGLGFNPGFMSNKPTHYLLSYGDFNQRRGNHLEKLKNNDHLELFKNLFSFCKL